MSKTGRVSREEESTLSLESGLEALRSSESFRGPVESLDGREAIEHMALIYEDRAEQLAATVPYLVQGLERGERCMCVLGPDEETAVIEELRRTDVDVDEALESGALTFYSVEETYLRNGTFDGDEMISFYADAIERTAREYEGLRVTATAKWVLDESTSTADFMAYESNVNDLFEGEDCIALCQYDRRRFPPSVMLDVIRTHPHLVYDNTVCHNFYYTPPETFFGPDEPAGEVDRMMRTLVERSEAKARLQERERYLRRHNDITARPDRSFEGKLQSLLDLGCERFGLELGGVASVDPATDRFVVEYVNDEHECLEPGLELPLSETYCVAATEERGPTSVTDPAGDGYAEIVFRREFGLRTYFGTHVEITGDLDRALFFVSSQPRDDPFSDEAHTFHGLMGQWMKYELERDLRDRALNDLYETAADPERSFETKVHDLLELGRKRYGLEIGFLSRVVDGSFEIVDSVGNHEEIQPGATAPLSETYCQGVFGENEPLAVDHAGDEAVVDPRAYDVYGLESYLGTTITVGDEPYGTLCFASTNPRDRPFSDDENTFLELTSQWISYELERRDREAQLAALNEMAQDLMSSDTEAAIAESTVQHAASTLQLPVTAVLSFDRNVGELRPLAQTDSAADTLPTVDLCDPESGALWEGFVADEVRTVDGDDTGTDELTEVIAVPLGTRGLFVTATSRHSGFCPVERDFVEATAATVETASVRAERERQLHEREAALETQNETLERLDRVNDIIRSIDQALVQASTRREIEAVVCEQLATIGPYELAWIGDHDPNAGEISPREFAGTEKGYLDGFTIDTGNAENAGPTALAVETREPQVANDVLSDESCGPWRQDALNRGYHAAISLPLIYQDECFGVLTLYAGQPGVFDEMESSVLAQLSDTIAYAINAVESKKALVNEEVTVLEFSVTDPAMALVDITSETNCTASIDRVFSRSDGQLRTYFTTRSVAADEVLALSSRIPVTRLDLVAEKIADGEPVCQFETDLEDDSLSAAIVNHGGRLREATASDGTATVIVELAADAAVREFVEMFRTRYPDSELVAQRSDARDYVTTAEFHETLTEELTPRQLEAIQTAYFSGFFERPRPRTGSEIADTMDISQPTFNGHLRSAQRKLCRRLFESEPS